MELDRRKAIIAFAVAIATVFCFLCLLLARTVKEEDCELQNDRTRANWEMLNQDCSNAMWHTFGNYSIRLCGHNIESPDGGRLTLISNNGTSQTYNGGQIMALRDVLYTCFNDTSTPCKHFPQPNFLHDAEGNETRCLIVPDLITLCLDRAQYVNYGVMIDGNEYLSKAELIQLFKLLSYWLER